VANLIPVYGASSGLGKTTIARYLHGVLTAESTIVRLILEEDVAPCQPSPPMPAPCALEPETIRNCCATASRRCSTRSRFEQLQAISDTRIARW
jgi:hypothetical protein